MSDQRISFIDRQKQFALSLPRSWGHPVRLMAMALFMYAHDDGGGIYASVHTLCATAGLGKSAGEAALKVLTENSFLVRCSTYRVSNGVHTVLRRLDLALIVSAAEAEGWVSSDLRNCKLKPSPESRGTPETGGTPSPESRGTPSPSSRGQTKRDNREKEPRDLTPIVPKPEKPSVEIPDWIPLEAWNGFLEMRKSIKKPLKTDYAVKLAIKKLDQLRDDGHDPADVLDQSTDNCWSGLFAVKGSHMRGSGQRLSQSAQNAEENAEHLLRMYRGI